MTARAWRVERHQPGDGWDYASILVAMDDGGHQGQIRAAALELMDDADLLPMSRGWEVVVVACRAREVIGAVLVNFDGGDLDPVRAAEIRYVVHPDHRRRCVGMVMVEAVVEWAAGWVDLYACPSTPAGVAFAAFLDDAGLADAIEWRK